MKNTIIDLSQPINPQMPPWPGSPDTEFYYLDQITDQDAADRHCNSSRFAMNIHCGTHMDAPFHFFNSGRTIGQVPLEQTYGLATLADLRHVGAGSHIDCADLLPFESQFRKTRKAILQTGWSKRWLEPEFFLEGPDLTKAAAQFLVDCNVELVGVETASVDFAPHDIHLILLGSGMLIVENLTNLDRIPAAEFLFSAIPLNFEGRDGSPVRAVAIFP